MKDDGSDGSRDSSSADLGCICSPDRRILTETQARKTGGYGGGGVWGVQFPPHLVLILRME